MWDFVLKFILHMEFICYFFAIFYILTTDFLFLLMFSGYFCLFPARFLLFPPFLDSSSAFCLYWPVHIESMKLNISIWYIPYVDQLMPDKILRYKFLRYLFFANLTPFRKN